MYDLIEHYNSGPKSEMVYEIPLTTGKPFYRNIAYQIAVENVKEGDLLVCNANAEVTSNNSYNILIATYIILTKQENDTEGLIICPPYGGNITLNQHHIPIYTGGSVIVDGNDYKYLTFVIYAASTAARPNDKVLLEPNYGRFYTLHYKPRKE